MLTTSASSSQVRAGMGRPPRSGCVTAGRKRHRSSPVNTTQRDGFSQQAVADGVAAYNPNSLAAGCPFPAGSAGYVHVPRTVGGPRLRVRAQSFSDHYSQATLFWESMSAPEQDHLVAAFSFELGKCLHEEVTDGVLANLANVSADLVARVAANLGTTAPDGTPATNIEPSPALSLVPAEPGPVAGRVIGIFAADGVDAAGLVAVRGPLERAGAVVVVIAAHGGTITSPDGPVEVTKSALTTQSVEYDALIVAGGSGAETLGQDPYLAVNLGEAYRHYKTIAAWGSGRDLLAACSIPADAPGVITADVPTRGFATAVIEAVGWHRHWDRPPTPTN